MYSAVFAALPEANLLLVFIPIVFVACFIFTTVGFGGGVVAVPLAALFLDPLVILPVLAIVEVFTVFRMVRLNRKQIVRADAVRIIPASVLGTVIGITLLINLPVRWLMFGMAGFVACFLVARLLTRKTSAPIVRVWAWPMGALAGLCSAAFGAGGPPIAIFLNMRRHSVAQARSTIATTGAANLIFRVTGFAVAGLYATPGILLAGLLLLPMAYFSIRVADTLRHRISDKQVMTATFVILGFSATTLFFRALTME